MQLEFAYKLHSGTLVDVHLRDGGSNVYLKIELRETYARIVRSGGVQLDRNDDADSDLNTWYEIRACVKGPGVIVEQRERGTGSWTEILSTDVAPAMVSTGIRLRAYSTSVVSFDEFTACQISNPGCGDAETDPDLSGASPIAFEDFESGMPAGWTTALGSFTTADSGSGGNDDSLKGTSTTNRIYVAHTDADTETRFSYKLVDIEDSYSNGQSVTVYPRWLANTQHLKVNIYPHGFTFRQTKSGAHITAAEVWPSSTEDQWYDVKITCDDDEIKVYRRKPGCAWALIYERDGLSITTTSRSQFVTKQDSLAFIDNVSVDEL